MGIYVKNARMPKACKWCEYTSCEKRIRSWHIERADDCPLIEVPEPHGRLIDADILAKNMREGQQTSKVKIWGILTKMSPTVIEAEGK